jgi:murein DD-endopeptidase MepM/ murein hydrolase activator NlpD
VSAQHTKYRYNTNTCRYEPVRPGIRNFFFTVIIFLTVSTSLFFTLLLLHSNWITTDKEVALKAENKALSEHHKILSSELITVKSSLASLGQKDKLVQQNLLASKTPDAILESLPVVKTKYTNLDFKELLNETTSRVSALLNTAELSNNYFGKSVAMNNDDITHLASIPALQPIDNPELTRLVSGYGDRINPFHKADYFHRGIDFMAPRGTPVYASATGKVIDVKRSKLPMGEGNVIELEHGNRYKTRYTHLGEIVVKPGQQVLKGTIIARIGMSGGSASPHLHFEVLKNNKPIDPAGFIMEGISPSDHVALLLLAGYKNQSLD